MLTEFTFILDDPVTGKDLFDSLYEFKLVEEGKKRVENIKEYVIKYNLEPSEKEKEILKKFGGGI